MEFMRFMVTYPFIIVFYYINILIGIIMLMLDEHSVKVKKCIEIYVRSLFFFCTTCLIVELCGVDSLTGIMLTCMLLVGLITCEYYYGDLSLYCVFLYIFLKLVCFFYVNMKLKILIVCFCMLIIFIYMKKQKNTELLKKTIFNSMGSYMILSSAYNIITLDFEIYVKEGINAKVYIDLLLGVNVWHNILLRIACIIGLVLYLAYKAGTLRLQWQK